MLKIFSYIITFLAGILVGKRNWLVENGSTTVRSVRRARLRKRVKIKYFDATSMVDKRRFKG